MKWDFTDLVWGAIGLCFGITMCSILLVISISIWRFV